MQVKFTILIIKDMNLRNRFIPILPYIFKAAIIPITTKHFLGNVQGILIKSIYPGTLT